MQVFMEYILCYSSAFAIGLVCGITITGLYISYKTE